MTVRSAQLTLLGLSLASILIVCLVFVTGRLWNFPLDYAAQEEIPLAQLAIPPFFAVIGSAAQFLKSPARVTIAADRAALLTVMIWLPGGLFLALFAVVTTVFHLANQPGSNTSFTLDSYRSWLTLLLALISLSVPVIASTVFKTRGNASPTI